MFQFSAQTVVAYDDGQSKNNKAFCIKAKDLWLVIKFRKVIERLTKRQVNEGSLLISLLNYVV